MTTLEEVFLHLERDEETEGTMDNMSKKIVRNRALSRSLSLQSKSTSYHSLQNEASNQNSTQETRGWLLTRKAHIKLPTFQVKIKYSISGFVAGAGDQTILPSLEMISETSPKTSTSPPFVGLEKIATTPNAAQTLLALLKLRVLRIVRDLQKLYFMVLMPLGLAALGLYFNRIQTTESRTHSLRLGAKTYGSDATRLAVYNGTGNDIDAVLEVLGELGVGTVSLYDGDFRSLLEMRPQMAALNFLKYEELDYGITVIYNDTMQHSLPIVMNLLSNVFYR